MSAPDLKAAMRLVRTLGLAPIKRIGNTRPDKLSAAGYQQWIARRREVEGEIASKLGTEGATIRDTGSSTVFRFAGISAGSTQGLGQALSNWTAAAEKRLNGGAW